MTMQTEVLRRIDQFISKKDCSICNSQEIEIMLDEIFPDNELIQDVVLMLASYSPSGGNYLYDENDIIQALNRVVPLLKSLSL